MRPAYLSTAAVRGSFADLETQVREFCAAGVPAIELGWAAPPRTSSVGDWLAAVPDTQFLVHNYFPQPSQPFVLNLASADEHVRARSIAMAEDAIRLSGRLNAPFYSVHAGFAAEFRPESLGHALDRHSFVPRAVALKTFRESVTVLATSAQLAAVDLLIEPNVVDRRNLVDGRNALLLLAEAEEIVSFLKVLNHPRVGLLLDTGHLNVSAHTLGFDRGEFVEAVAPWVRGLHIHDNDGSSDQHRALDAGSWVLDMLRDARFAARPMVLESVFASVAEAAEYRVWFDGIRGL